MKKYNRLDQTDSFELYQQGIDYKQRIDYFAKTDLYWAFYNGDQWRGIKAGDLPKITMNIARTAIDYMVANIMSQKISINFRADNVPDESDDESDQEKKAYAEFQTNSTKTQWEKDKMDAKIRQALIDGANSGDMGLYTYWDASIETGQPEKGNRTTDNIDGTNIFFGNPNTPLVEKQPWIIITGRDTIKALREEAKANGASKEEIDSIQADNDTDYQTGDYGKIEMNAKSDTGKCLYVIKFWKEDGVVHWSKKTRYCSIRKDVSMDIKRYPIAYANWRGIKNSMHGMGVMRGIMDNQIALNQLHAMIVLWMRYNSFGKTIYDRTRISSWSNKLNGAIAADGDVTGIVHQLQAGNFNNAIVQYAELLMNTTKDLIGASDAALGNVRPENTSAIIAIAKQAAIPLENVQANLYQLAEDWSNIDAEFTRAKFVNRKTTYTEEGKQKVAQFKKPSDDLMLSVIVDVGPSTYYSEQVGIQALENLFMSDKITAVQFFDRVSKFNVIPDCDGLAKDAREQESKMGAPQNMGEAQMPEMPPEQMPPKSAEMPMEEPPVQDDYEQLAQFLESLPPEEQQRVMELPEGQREEALRFMLGQID